MDRREFMRAPALAGALAARWSVSLAAAGTAPAGLAGHVTMAALAGDSVRLAMCSSAISTPMKDALAGNPDLVRLGGLLKLAVEDVPGLLEAYGEKKAAGRELALVLGSLVERSAARRLQPALGADAECDLYRDVTLVGAMSAGLGPGNPAAAADLHDLLLLLDTRRLIGIHTFSPDAGDTDLWLTGLIQWRRGQHALLKRYAEVYSAPDPALVRKYVSDPGFYGRQDGLIRIARAVQNGAVVGRGELGPALKAAGTQSQYARALGQGHDSLAAASAFLARSIDAGALLRRLNG